MKIYVVSYPTGYDHDDGHHYFLKEENARTWCDEQNQVNPGYDWHVSDIETED
jgi:hypothetical protein